MLRFPILTTTPAGKSLRLEVTITCALAFTRRSGDVAVFRIIGHQDGEFLVILDQSFGKVELDLFCQMRDFLWSQFPAALQIAALTFRPDLIRPPRNVEPWCFRQAQERIAQRSRQQNAGIENRDDVAARGGQQSELVINAVFDSVPGHLVNRLMTGRDHALFGMKANPESRRGGVCRPGGTEFFPDRGAVRGTAAIRPGNSRLPASSSRVRASQPIPITATMIAWACAAMHQLSLKSNLRISTANIPRRQTSPHGSNAPGALRS